MEFWLIVRVNRLEENLFLINFKCVPIVLKFYFYFFLTGVLRKILFMFFFVILDEELMTLDLS